MSVSLFAGCFIDCLSIGCSVLIEYLVVERLVIEGVVVECLVFEYSVVGSSDECLAIKTFSIMDLMYVYCVSWC